MNFDVLFKSVDKNSVDAEKFQSYKKYWKRKKRIISKGQFGKMSPVIIYKI